MMSEEPANKDLRMTAQLYISVSHVLMLKYDLAASDSSARQKVL